MRHLHRQQYTICACFGDIFFAHESIVVAISNLWISKMHVEAVQMQSSDCDVQVYAGPLKGGSRAVVLFNRHSITTQYPISNVTVTWEQLGYPSDIKADVRDLHAAKTLGVFQDSFTAGVDIHDAVMLKITPQKAKADYEEWRPWPSRHSDSSLHSSKPLLQRANLHQA